MPNHPGKKQRRGNRVKKAKHRRNGNAAVCAGGGGKVTKCAVCLGRAGRTRDRVQTHERCQGLIEKGEHSEPSNRQQRKDRRLWGSFRMHRSGVDRWTRNSDVPYLSASELCTPLAN